MLIDTYPIIINNIVIYLVEKLRLIIPTSRATMSFSSFKVLVQKSYITRAWDGYTYFATLTFYGRPEKEWKLLGMEVEHGG